ncbi:hypothetical protein [Kibdelosporangium philippinense]|uniref:hypothetical protein n=1 Tax=Kibdelosporangium philippinense TaxID=211113 RepID=UPI00361FEAE8
MKRFSQLKPTSWGDTPIIQRPPSQIFLWAAPAKGAGTTPVPAPSPGTLSENPGSAEYP